MNNSIINNDKNRTYDHREKIDKNLNILMWYKNLYKKQMEAIDYNKSQSVLEIGSGASVLSKFYPNVITSDILMMDYVKLCLDAQNLDTHPKILAESFDAILFTNVLHHIEKPIEFFKAAKTILKPGGKICLTEPLFSWLGCLIYYCAYPLHKEKIVFNSMSPVIDNYKGPLTSANMALPHLILVKRKFFHYIEKDFKIRTLQYYTAISYFASGGAKFRFYLPHKIYKLLFNLDQRLADKFPMCFASFFTMVLEKTS